MKKILLSTAVTLLLCIVALAQENPCPTVSGVRKTNVRNNGNGTCSATVTLHITNDVSQQPKGVQVEVLCGSATPVSTTCFIATTTLGGTDFTTAPFTCPCNASITIRITRFTSSNGNCQGGTCGNVLIIQQSPLPVNLVSFTAKRNTSAVSLKWETASEQNNNGFAVERNIKGSWEQVAFIPSQAANGNSDQLLSYQYNDINNTKGVTQYRIKQVDIDAKTKYSEIRAVRGDGQVGKTIVYPNPTNNGKVSVVFEDGSVSRDVSVMDMSGRIIKQYKAVVNNNITIENLTPGMYSLRVFVPSTGEQVVEKIVVNKR